MKLFASDYDGTFFKHSKRKKFEVRNNIRSVKKWQDEGNLFIFATGRSISMMDIERKFKGIKYDYIVGLNGGIIVSKDNDILFQKTINSNISHKIIDLIKKEKINTYFITDGITGHYQKAFNWRKKSSYYFLFMRTFLKWYDLTLEEALSQPVAQIAVETAGHKEAIAFAKLVNETFPGEVTAFANLHHVDISAPNLSKATGVEYVANLHKIKGNQIYGMGDSHNDVPMFEKYHGITLPEATDEIKQQADSVYETVEDALKDILKK